MRSRPLVLAQAAAADRLDPDRGPVELELHFAAAGQPDPVAERARDDQTPCLVNGRPHGIDHTTAVAPTATRQRGAAAAMTT